MLAVIVACGCSGKEIDARDVRGKVSFLENIIKDKIKNEDLLVDFDLVIKFS